MYLSDYSTQNNTQAGIYFWGRVLSDSEISAMYSNSTSYFPTQFIMNDLQFFAPMDEGSGIYAYGYDAFTNFTLQGSPQALNISHQSGGVNSTLYWGVANNFTSGIFPYTSGADTWSLATGSATYWRVNNSMAQTLYLNHYKT